MRTSDIYKHDYDILFPMMQHSTKASCSANQQPPWHPCESAEWLPEQVGHP